MSSFRLSEWLDQNQDEIVKYWQAAIRDQDLLLLRLDPGSDQQTQCQEFGRLYRDIVDATSSEWGGDRGGLVEWTRRCRHENGASLVNLLHVVFALRGAAGELLTEPAHADHAVNGWRALIPLFDRTVEVLAASYMQPVESPVDSDSTEKMQVATTGEKEHIDALYAIGRELNVSLDLDHVLEKTLNLVTRAVGARHGSVMLLDHDTGDLVYRARLGGRGPLPVGGEITPFKPGVGVAGWVVEHRKPALIGNVLEDDRWLAIRGKSPLTRALIAAPLLVGEDLHGVILISDGTPHRFSESHLKLVIAAAQQVAQTIRNAQLYDHVRGSADQLARMLRREQEETSKHQAVLQSIADGVIVSDIQDRVIVFNATAEAILEREADVVVGQDVCQLFDAFEEPGRSDALTALTKVRTLPDQTTGQVVETRLESNSKVISARLTPVVTEGAESLGVVIALRDITRIVEVDRAKSEFVSTVSHELRTPLTSIKGYADLLRAEAVGGINEHQRQFLDIVKNNADRLTALINDLLDISYIETGRVRLQLDSVSLAETVQSVVESLRPQIEAKGLKLEVDVPDHVDEITGDRARLIQVVTNLLDNACKYTDEGRIRVSLSCIEPSVDESIGRAVRLDVVDSGIGMSMEDQGRIFERFYRADATIREGRGGTGLGLAIASELIELHRGRIWVTSELGAGSTFTVILPSVVQELSAPLLAQVPAGARKILVVDDERDILALLQYQLGIQGYRVITASTGEQAIIKAIEERPDLITLDILLPDRNGFDVLRELKSRSETCHIPVIVLSVIQSEDSGYRLGVADYLVKPLDEGRLLGSISRLLGLRGKVLIAEDHPDTAEMLITLLRECGYEPLYASDGYETLAIARREQPGLILLDLRMPGMDGYEALTRLKKDPETRRIPILVMSAHAADVVQERLRVKGMGAADFLAKPFSLENLLQEIERVTVRGGDSAN